MKINACSKSYGAKTVMRCEGLELKPAQVYAVIGANDSGKSTFARLVSGALPADRNVKVLTGAAQVRYMPQKSHAFRMSTLSNILLGGGGRARAGALMRALHLEELSGRRAKALSGGETAKMALARVLMQPSELLILDEPTAAMDMESAAAGEQLILDYRRRTGCTVLLITHDLQQARRLADQAIFFCAGNLLESGMADKVLFQPEKKETRQFLDFYGSV